MKVHWLIDAEMFGAYREDLVSAVRGAGHEPVLLRTPSPPYRWKDVDYSYRKLVPEEACVVAHGDIELCTRIYAERRWRPGAFCSVEKFYWSNYACHLSELLLNDDYVMLPFGELSRRRDYVFDSIGAAGRVFIRPDSPLKLFTGQVASADSFEADLEFMAFYDFPPSSLVVVSSPKEIESEWRFIVAGGEVITGCLYCKDGEHQPAPGSHQGAYDLAAVAASSSWQPDPVWVVDVCRTSAGEYRLLEVGGFSYSDLYATDKTAIAEAVSAAAIQVWVQHEAG